MKNHGKRYTRPNAGIKCIHGRSIVTDVIALAVVVSLLGGCSTAERTLSTLLLRAYALSQAHRYQFKLMKIPESAQVPDFFDFDPDMMKVLFNKGRELGRNPSSWIETPSPGQDASPWIINLLSELRRER